MEEIAYGWNWLCFNQSINVALQRVGQITNLFYDRINGFLHKGHKNTYTIVLVRDEVILTRNNNDNIHITTEDIFNKEFL